MMKPVDLNIDAIIDPLSHEPLPDEFVRIGGGVVDPGLHIDKYDGSQIRDIAPVVHFSFPVQSVVLKDGNRISHQVTIQHVLLGEVEQRLALQDYPDNFRIHLSHPEATHCFLAIKSDGEIVGYLVARIKPPLGEGVMTFNRGHKKNYRDQQLSLKGIFWAMTAYVLVHTRPLWQEKGEHDPVVGGILLKILDRFRSREVTPGVRSPVSESDTDPFRYDDELLMGRIPRNEAEFVTSLFEFDGAYTLDEEEVSSGQKKDELAESGVHRARASRIPEIRHRLRGHATGSRLARLAAKL